MTPAGVHLEVQCRVSLSLRMLLEAISSGSSPGSFWEAPAELSVHTVDPFVFQLA